MQLEKKNREKEKAMSKEVRKLSKNKKVIGIVLLVAIILIAIGYAAISTLQLNISGQAQATPQQSNFTVIFSGTPEVSDPSKVTAEITESNNLKATMNVTGLVSKGDTVTATYTIENTSNDLAAALSAEEPTNSNTEYFDVSYDIAQPTIQAGETTTVTVTVELIKTPITADESSTIGLTINADPQQP